MDGRQIVKGPMRRNNRILYLQKLFTRALECSPGERTILQNIKEVQLLVDEHPEPPLDGPYQKDD